MSKPRMIRARTVAEQGFKISTLKFKSMKTANPPAKHHYIPAFYLRRWRDSNGKVIEYTKPYKTVVSKPIAPESTGYQERLYELQGYEAELAQQIEEKFFKPIDTLASQSLELLARYGHQAPWTSESRSAWTRFVLSLLLRCPEDIAAFREGWRENFHSTDESSEAQYREIRQSNDLETFSEFLASQPLAKKERYQFQILCSLIDHEVVGGKINEMHWRVLEAPARAPRLLTSDRPVIRTNGLAREGGHIALPIGPRLLFIASHHTKFLGDILRTDQIALVKECNRQIVESAARFVYDVDESQRRFVENRFGKTPQPRLMEGIVQRRRDWFSSK